MEILQKIGNFTLLFLLKIILGVHEFVTSLALFLDFSFFSTYLLLWLVCGLLGAAIYKKIAEGPANPLGKTEEERKTFWFIFLTGPFGFIMAVVSALLSFSQGKEIPFRDHPVNHLKVTKRLDTSKITEEDAKRLRGLL